MNPNETARRSIFWGDIRRHSWMYFKAVLMLVAGVLASILILIDHPTVRTAVLLAVAIWGFCRAYYFAFYVIEHYVDPTFRFSGLTSFLRYVAKRTQIR
jgi:hypothetical protein